jgi:hypothetical protein
MSGMQNPSPRGGPPGKGAGAPKTPAPRAQGKVPATIADKTPKVGATTVDRTRPHVFCAYSSTPEMLEFAPMFPCAFGKKIGKLGHPMLHFYRCVAEYYAFKKLRARIGRERIIDVGGNPRHHASSKQTRGGEIHCISPVVDVTDIGRQYYSRYEGQSCDHLAQDCTCDVGAAAMFVHSLYYFTAREVYDIVLRNGGHGMTVIHHFVGETGVFHDGPTGVEARWARGDDGNITMVVRGNLSPYVHASVDWVNLRHEFDGNVMLFVPLDSFGSSYVYGIHIFAAARAPKPAPVAEASLTLAGYTKRVNPKLRVVDNQPTLFPVNPRWVGRHLCAQVRGRDMLFPDKCYDDGINFIRSKERTPANYRALERFFLDMTKRATNSPGACVQYAGLDADHIQALALLCFLDDLGDETLVYDHLSDLTSTYARHARALRFEGGTCCPCLRTCPPIGYALACLFMSLVCVLSIMTAPSAAGAVVGILAGTYVAAKVWPQYVKATFGGLVPAGQPVVQQDNAPHVIDVMHGVVPVDQPILGTHSPITDGSFGDDPPAQNDLPGHIAVPSAPPEDEIKQDGVVQPVKAFSCTPVPADDFGALHQGLVDKKTHGCVSFDDLVDDVFAVAPTSVVNWPKINVDIPLKPVEEPCVIKRFADAVDPTREQFYYQIGPALAGYIPGAHANNINNEAVALHNRHVRGAPNDEHTTQAWNHEFCKEARTILARQTGFVRNANEHDWILHQPPKKRQKYADMLASSQHLLNKRHTHTRSFFIKNELLIPTKERSVWKKSPRGIQGAKEEVLNLMCGPQIQAIHKATAAPFLKVDLDTSSVSHWPQFGFTSGSDSERIGQWFADMLYDGFDFLEDDFSEYDSTQGRGALLNERAYYASVCDLSPTTYEALHAQDDTYGIGRYHKYQVPYTRKSGDQNTTIGNTVNNFTAHHFALRQACTTVHYEIEYNMLGLGDDNVVALKIFDSDGRRISRGTAEFAAFVADVEVNICKLGLKPKLVAPEPHLVSYCSMEFMPAIRTVEYQPRETFVPVAKLERVLCKFGFTVQSVSALSDDELRGRLKGIVLGQQALLHLPIARAMLAPFAEYAGVAVKVDDHPEARTYSGSVTFDNDIVEEWFYRQYQTHRLDVDELENYLYSCGKTANGRPFIWYHHCVDPILDGRR